MQLTKVSFIFCRFVTKVKISDVGLETLRTSCEIRHRYNLLEFLSSEPAEVLVHGSCRKSFTRSNELKKIKLQLEYPTER